MRSLFGGKSLIKSSLSKSSAVTQGYSDSDLTFTPNLWNGVPNVGEFTVGGTYFEPPDALPGPIAPAAVFETTPKNGASVWLNDFGFGVMRIRLLSPR